MRCVLRGGKAEGQPSSVVLLGVKIRRWVKYGLEEVPIRRIEQLPRLIATAVIQCPPSGLLQPRTTHLRTVARLVGAGPRAHGPRGARLLRLMVTARSPAADHRLDALTSIREKTPLGLRPLACNAILVAGSQKRPDPPTPYDPWCARAFRWPPQEGDPHVDRFIRTPYNYPGTSEIRDDWPSPSV